MEGPQVGLNFDIETYANELEELQSLSKEEVIVLARQSSNRGLNKLNYLGVCQESSGKFQAAIR